MAIDLRLDDNGDIIITKNKIAMNDEKNALKQKCKLVLSTNKGEWEFNKNEGINFKNVLGKNISDDSIKSEIVQGLKQIDSTYYITSCNIRKNGRMAIVEFTAKNGKGKIAGGEVTWQ